MPAFQIIKQVNLQSGCIPCCAASILRYHGIAGDWTESHLLQMWRLPSGSGFERLRGLLEADQQMAEWSILIKGRAEIDLKRFLIKERDGATPVLFAVKQGEGNPAHCVVITESDDLHSLVFDPWPDRPDSCLFRYDQLNSMWAGDIFYLKKRL